MAEERTTRMPNAEQQAVIDDFSHNILLFASAGTGKTFTVAQKIARALREGRYRPEEILCLTFTVKACREMANDIVDYTQGLAGAEEVYCNTIHGFCYHLLRNEARLAGGRAAEPPVCDEVDCEQILQEIILPHVLARSLPHDRPLTNVNLFHLVSAIKRYRVLYELPRQPGVWHTVFRLLREREPAAFEKLFAFRYKGSYSVDRRLLHEMETHIDALITEYERYLQMEERLDYDDLIIGAWEALQEEPVRQRWLSRCRLLFVDEMQDTSLLEYKVLGRLFAENRIMMCGDYFQSIYGWRGAAPDAVLVDFEQRYQAKRYMLTRNYRATQMLTKACFGYLQNMFGDAVSHFYPPQPLAAQACSGEKIDLYTLPYPEAEADLIFDLLRRMPAKEREGVCILARSNRYIRLLYDCFRQRNAALPAGERLRFFTAGEDVNLFKRSEIKDILAYLRLVANPYDGVSLEWAVRRYLPAVTPYVRRKLREAGACGLSICSFLQQASYAQGDPYAPLLAAAEAGGAPLVVFDTETTGLDLARDEVIQIAAARVDAAGNILAQMNRFIRPTRMVSSRAEQVHGYSNEFLRHHGIAAQEALAEFRTFSAGAILVGHNSAAFDLAMIERALRENHLPPLAALAHYDTLPLVKMFYPELENHRLETLCQSFGIVNVRAHDAFSDVAATAAVLAHLLQNDLPRTAEKRQAIVTALLPRFRSFFAFYQELCRKLCEEGLFALTSCAVTEGGVRERYLAEPERLAAIDDLLEIVAVRAKTAQNQLAALYDLLLGASLSGGELDLLLRETHKIPMITVHQAKGCEFRTVFVAGVDEMNFPSYASQKSAGGEKDEQHLFYVALSRAREKLILTCSRNGISLRGHAYPQAESPYLADIPPQTLCRHAASAAEMALYTQAGAEKRGATDAKG